MRKKRKQLIGILLCFLMVLELIPGLSIKAYADDPYASLKNSTIVITFDNKDWYLIDYDSSTVTLLSKECIGTSKYDENGASYEYEGSTIKSYVDNWYRSNISADAKAAVIEGKMFLLTTEQAEAIENVNSLVLRCDNAGGTDPYTWWLCSRGVVDTYATYVFGDYGIVFDFGAYVGHNNGVRPALQLDLSQVSFDAEKKTFSLIMEQVATPTFSPAAGNYDSLQNVTITTDTAGAEIFFTMDGTTPTMSSTKYTAAIAIDETTTIKAIAVKEGMADSEVASAAYTIDIAEPISYNVTFKVVNGAWDDGEIANKTETLNGAAGDTLKLSAEQIPAAGTKPADGYKEGSWDVMPNTDTTIITDTVYTYTYAMEEEVPKEDVTGVILDNTALELTEGASGTLTITVVPDDASDKTVIWSSDKTSVATVDANGKVTAVKAGKAIITVTATNGTEVTTDDKTASCTVTVTEAETAALKTNVIGVTLDHDTVLLAEGESVTLTATVAPANATDKTVICTSSNKTVATVDNSGKVIAVAAGTTIITVTATNGTDDTADDKTATCEVTVTEAKTKTDITGITLDKTTVSLEMEQTETLAVTVEPEDATDKTVTFRSGDENIVTVDEEGKITAVAEGSTMIMVTATNGTESADDDQTATCIVTVTAKKTSPEIPEEGTALVKDDQGKQVYYKDGELQKDYSGLVNVGGTWYYVEKGILLENKTGFAEYEGGIFLVSEGKLLTSKSGLVQDPYNLKTWYFLAEGQAQIQYTGLAYYDGEWFYVEKGILNTELAGFVEYDGGLFFVGAGRIMKEVNGLAQDPNGSDWYYVAEGQAQIQYTGLAFYDGEWFYVVDGKLAADYTGNVEYDGTVFYVENGMVK